MKSICATVARHTGSHYMLTVLPAWNLFPAVVRGKIRLQKSKATNPIAVGDSVMCHVPDEFDTCGADCLTPDSPAVITEVLPRSNYIIRKSTNLSRQAHVIAANIDRAFVVVTLAFPEVKLPFLDRLLVTCEVYGVPVTIVLNKMDMMRPLQEMVNVFKSIYSEAGYDIIETSAKTGEGIEELRRAMATSEDGSKHGVNLLSGVSGVGKSSLIRALDPKLEPRTGEISEAHLQGKHTTTFYEMYPLSSGGFIIDTPGIRSFGLVDLEPEEVSKYFPEMLRISDNCRFTPCTHTHEPGCAIKEAVDAGEISADRYNSYLGMLEEYNKYR